MRKQILAVTGDDSEEGRAKRQQLGAQLKEAEENLQETEYDRYIQDQTEILNEFYQNLQDWINERLDNIELLFEEAIEATNVNAALINEVLQTESENVGYTITDEFAKIWENASEGLAGQNDILGATNEACSTIISDVEALPTMDGLSAYLDGETLAIVNEITSVDNAVGSVESAIHETNAAISQIASNVAEYNASVIRAMSNAQAAAEQAQRAAEAAQRTADDAKRQASQSSSNPAPSTPPSSGSKAGSNEGRNYRINQIYEIATGHKINKEYNDLTLTEAQRLLEELKQRGWIGTISHYAKGGMVTNKDKNPLDFLARTFGEDHMVATREGERILTEEQNKNFEKLANQGFVPLDANAQAKFDALIDSASTVGLNKALSSLHAAAVIPPNENNAVSNVDVGGVNINLPNVTNKQEFVTWLKNDKQIENIVKAMTLGTAMGGNSYTKMKF